MAPPQIKVYFYGRPNNYKQPTAPPGENEFGWYRAGWAISGDGDDVDQSVDGMPTSRYLMHFPTVFMDIAGGQWVTITSDAIVGGGSVKHWSAIPICIINDSTKTMEEVNFAINAHYWSKGTGGTSNDTGDFDDFWSDFRHLYDTGSAWQDDEGTVIPHVYNTNPPGTLPHGYPDFSAGPIFFGDGWRSGGVYDAVGSIYQTSSISIINQQRIAFAPVQNDSGFDVADVNWESDLFAANSCGDPTDTGDPIWGSYVSNYSETAPYSINHCMFADFNATNFSPRYLGYLWTQHVARGGQKNQFGRATLNRTGSPSFFSTGVTPNKSIWSTRQIIRGYLILSIYNNAFSTDAGQTLTLGSLEGSVYGKFFAGMSITARYYD